MEIELTSLEKRKIKQLKRLAKDWPPSLWLFSANGTLCVMRFGPDGGPALSATGGVDNNYCVVTIQGIYNDGGDW